MYIDKTNEVMMNYYKKQEILKAKQRFDEEKMPIVQVLRQADKEFITIDELLEALYIDKEEVLEKILNTQSVSENITDVSVNTTNVSGDTPMKIAKTYKEYYEKYNHDRKQICKDKKIANGTFQKYLRLNFLIPELQELVNNQKLSILSAAYISFLEKDYQEIINYLVQYYSCEITSGVAKRIKEDYLLCKKKNENFYLNESVIKKYKKEKSIKVSFSQDEIEKFFNGMPKHSLKEYIISIAKNTHDVLGYILWIFKKNKR